ncbi:hypothetical protein ACHAWT_003801 [Skeletonema menzelii]
MPRREVDPDIYCPQAALVDKETADRVERRLARYRAKIKAQQHYMIMMKQQQQQQRMIWMGSGVMLLMAVSCFMWYKKSKKQHHRRHDNNNNSDVDLISPELQQLFNEAAKASRQLTMLDQRDQLMLYGLYKQALHGDADSSTAPSKLNVVARAKHDAWKKFTGLPTEFAMEKYCEVVYHFLNGGASSFTGENNDDNDDIIYHDDEEHEEDLDEDGCPIHQDDDDNNYLDSGMMGIRQSTLMLTNNNVLQSESSPEIRLRNAALSSNKEALEQAIRDGANLDDADESGQTALHFSADKGCIDCMRLLLHAGANVNATDQDGIGVLQTAVVAGIDVEGVRVLLEGGADPDAEDDDGDSPRSTALDEGRSELVELFDLYPSR